MLHRYSQAIHSWINKQLNFEIFLAILNLLAGYHTVQVVKVDSQIIVVGACVYWIGN